jgi:hypothetical protein
VLAAGTNGIIVNLPAATDRVVLQGLDIEGANTGLNGIRMIGLGRLIVRNSDIRNFRGGTGFGIDVQPHRPRVMIENHLHQQYQRHQCEGRRGTISCWSTMR